MGLFNKKDQNTTDPKEFVHPEPRFYSEDEVQRKEGESTQEYNERIPVAYQPVAEQPKTNYLGEPRE